MNAMQTEKLLRKNLSVFPYDHPLMIDLRFLFGAVTDSEIFRLSVRHLEQLAEDTKEERRLVVEPVEGVGPAFCVDYPLLRQRSALDSEGSLEKRIVQVNQFGAECIDFIKMSAGLTSESEVVRWGLRYLAILGEQAAAGASFSILDREGVDTPVRMNGLPRPLSLNRGRFTAPSL